MVSFFALIDCMIMQWTHVDSKARIFLCAPTCLVDETSRGCRRASETRTNGGKGKWSKSISGARRSYVTFVTCINIIAGARESASIRSCRGTHRFQWEICKPNYISPARRGLWSLPRSRPLNDTTWLSAMSVSGYTRDAARSRAPFNRSASSPVTKRGSLRRAKNAARKELSKRFIHDNRYAISIAAERREF